MNVNRLIEREKLYMKISVIFKSKHLD